MSQLKSSVGTILFMAVALSSASNSQAQAYSVIHSFSRGDGSWPSSLIRASDGNFYGATYYWGIIQDAGTIFKMDLSGNVTTLYQFGGPAYPYGLVEGTDGFIYGVTQAGGGTIFKLDVAGNLTTLHSFANTAISPTGLTQAADGNFYGGIGNTIFRMDASGNLTTIHTFTGNDGSGLSGPLLQGRDGSLYGTTATGGANGGGTIFKIDFAGNLTTLHAIGATDGWAPSGSLVQSADGAIYGTTLVGGTEGLGTFYKLDAAGNLAVLHSFTRIEGFSPLFGLTLASDGTFYGIMSDINGYGDFGNGNVFRADSAGNLTTLHYFAGFTAGFDGAHPMSLLQGSDGNIYGTAGTGGRYNEGIVFKLLLNPSTGPCVPDSTTLCLQSGRFQVRVAWEAYGSGPGIVVPGAVSNDSGVMWFFGPDNWELLIKVLNGCAVNGHYWVFGAAATNVEYRIQVTDTQTGEVRTYTNPLGMTSPAITDTAAFRTCP